MLMLNYEQGWLHLERRYTPDCILCPPALRQGASLSRWPEQELVMALFEPQVGGNYCLSRFEQV